MKRRPLSGGKKKNHQLDTSKVNRAYKSDEEMSDQDETTIVRTGMVADPKDAAVSAFKIPKSNSKHSRQSSSPAKKLKNGVMMPTLDLEGAGL